MAWSVRGLIVGSFAGGTAEKAYANAAVKVRSGNIKSVDHLFAELQSIVPTDEQFESAFATALLPRSNLARYYLIALEKGKKGDPEPEFVPNSDEEQVNLEHVLPKNASEAEWGKAFKPDERRDLPYRMGNLALLKKGRNGKIGNEAFTAKKPILAVSQFDLTKEIGAEADWTPAGIATRQERLASLAKQVWPRKA